MAHCQPLNELIELTPCSVAPLFARRGTVYEELRRRGESDYVAAAFAFHPPAAPRALQLAAEVATACEVYNHFDRFAALGVKEAA